MEPYRILVVQLGVNASEANGTNGARSAVGAV